MMIYQVLALGVVELLRAKFETNKGQVSLEKTFSDFGEMIAESSTLRLRPSFSQSFVSSVIRERGRGQGERGKLLR